VSTSNVPNFGQELPSARRPRERNPVTWIIIALVALVVYSCGRGAYGAYRVADPGTDHFHEMLNQAQSEEIYGQATDGFPEEWLPKRRFGIAGKDP
jgi:hypothetical protein